MMSAAARCGVVGRACASSCSARHSPRLRAPTPGRVEVLQVLQRDGKLLGLDFEFRRQHVRRDFRQVLVEVAVVVERIDEQATSRGRARGASSVPAARAGVRAAMAARLRPAGIALVGVLARACRGPKSRFEAVRRRSSRCGSSLGGLRRRCRAAPRRPRPAVSRGGRAVAPSSGAAVVLALEQGVVLQELLDLLVESSVDSCSSRIDCCSCGVSVRC